MKAVRVFLQKTKLLPHFNKKKSIIKWKPRKKKKKERKPNTKFDAQKQMKKNDNTTRSLAWWQSRQLHFAIQSTEEMNKSYMTANWQQEEHCSNSQCAGDPWYGDVAGEGRTGMSHALSLGRWNSVHHRPDLHKHQQWPHISPYI